MNHTLYSLAIAILTASTVMSADTKTTKTTTTKPDGSAESNVTTTTSKGTVTEYVPGTTFIVKEVTGPVSYIFGKTVTYMTKTGKVLTDNSLARRIKSGAKVSVHYVMDGTRRVVNKIIVDDD